MQDIKEEENDDSIVKKLRSYRIGKIAIFDLVASMTIMELTTQQLNLPKYTGIILTIPTGILVHKLLDINTPITDYFTDTFMDKSTINDPVEQG